MTSQARIDANRKNALKSTGPRTEAGKARARLNGLKHGLRSQEVVLPTEDPEQFDSHLKAWMDDWQPPTETRRFLVERAATAAWKLKRIARIETDRMADRIDKAGDEWEENHSAEVARSVRKLGVNPAQAIAELEGSCDGVNTLVDLWVGLLVTLDAPEKWDSVEKHHTSLCQLIALTEDDPDKTEIAMASWGILLRSHPELADEDEPAFTDDELPAAVERLQKLCETNIDRLTLHFKSVTDESVARIRYAELKAFASLAEDQTLQRYEARLDREAKSSINMLIRLEKTNADLQADLEAPTEPNTPAPDASCRTTEPNAPASEPTPRATEPNESAPLAPPTQVERDRNGRVWPIVTVAEVAEDVTKDV